MQNKKSSLTDRIKNIARKSAFGISVLGALALPALGDPANGESELWHEPSREEYMNLQEVTITNNVDKTNLVYKEMFGSGQVVYVTNIKEVPRIERVVEYVTNSKFEQIPVIVERTNIQRLTEVITNIIDRTNIAKSDLRFNFNKSADPSIRVLFGPLQYKPSEFDEDVNRFRKDLHARVYANLKNSKKYEPNPDNVYSELLAENPLEFTSSFANCNKCVGTYPIFWSLDVKPVSGNLNRYTVKIQMASKPKGDSNDVYQATDTLNQYREVSKVIPKKHSPKDVSDFSRDILKFYDESVSAAMDEVFVWTDTSSMFNNWYPTSANNMKNTMDDLKEGSRIPSLDSYIRENDEERDYRHPWEK